MTCRNAIKNKIQKVVNYWLDIFSVKKSYLMNKWNVCYLGFAIMLQKKLSWFSFFINDYNNYMTIGVEE